jgi:thermostable 8-oxoguanine DNA glycosylase
MTVEPRNITNFQRSEYELQEFLLFCVAVAGKSSDMQARKLDIFLAPHSILPFERINRLVAQGNFMDVLMQSKIGQYKRISKAWTNLAKSGLDLRTCTVEELEKIEGFGCKTSRFFLMHSRPNQEVAVLDTHILRWMRGKGWKAPKSTPPLKKYKELEVAFLMECVWAGMTPATLDLFIWKQGQKQVIAMKGVMSVSVAA